MLRVCRLCLLRGTVHFQWRRESSGRIWLAWVCLPATGASLEVSVSVGGEGVSELDGGCGIHWV